MNVDQPNVLYNILTYKPDQQPSYICSMVFKMYQTFCY